MILVTEGCGGLLGFEIFDLTISFGLSIFLVTLGVKDFVKDFLGFRYE